MGPLRTALTTYRPTDEQEARDLARAVALLDTADPWSRDLPMHVTASALVVHDRSRRLLLRWHVRQEGWLQVGGHGDRDESDPWRVALREAEEETGLADLTALHPGMTGLPIQVVAVSVPAGRSEPAHEHIDIRYVLATATPQAARAESPDAPVRWFTFDEARELITEANLRVFVDRVEQILAAQE